jgi:hypothetical protein
MKKTSLFKRVLSVLFVLGLLSLSSYLITSALGLFPTNDDDNQSTHRTNEVIISLRNDTSGDITSVSNLLSFLNTNGENEEIFTGVRSYIDDKDDDNPANDETIHDFSYLSREQGGLKVGNDLHVGSFYVSVSEDYYFTGIEVIGKNSDETHGGLSINQKAPLHYPSVEYAGEVLGETGIEFTFTSSQDHIQLIGIDSFIYIYEIILFSVI